MNPFSMARGADGDHFDDNGTFVRASLPDPGPFLEAHDVLADDDHARFHELTRECFEERGVYDATFGYNLAELNLDRRHPDAGFRYAIERPARVDQPDDAPDADDVPESRRVIRAEFTPTTEFCPQGEALTRGAFRAWNGLSERHEFELVRVRVRPTHYQAAAINESLERLEREYESTGRLDDTDWSSEASDGSRDSPF